MNYYVADGTTQRGPFTATELAGMGLGPQTLIWREGMAQWQPIQTLPELRELILPPISLQSAQTGTAPAEAGAWPARSAPQQTGPLPVSYATPPHGLYNAPPFDPASSNRVAAGVCGILLGAFGVHKFILGLTSGAVTMLCITLGGLFFGMGCGCVFLPLALLGFGPPVMGIIGLIEGILYLTKSDEEFYLQYIVRKRQWF